MRKVVNWVAWNPGVTAAQVAARYGATRREALAVLVAAERAGRVSRAPSPGSRPSPWLWTSTGPPVRGKSRQRRRGPGKGDSAKWDAARITYDGISNQQIFERDGWQCQMPVCECPAGRVIDPWAPKNTHWAPTVDHITPIGDGGDDTAANKRAAHSLCNYAAALIPPTPRNGATVAARIAPDTLRALTILRLAAGAQTAGTRSLL